MPIIIKTRREIEMMRRAGQVGCEILAKMREAVAPGVSTQELNEIARRELARAGAVGLSKNYPTYKPGEGFPAETCISVNEEVVHGIPGSRQLREGDIVTLDLALMLDGYCADTATTVPVGRISPEVRKLLDVTRQTLALALNNIKPGRRWTEIARLMQYHVESNGFSVVREFVGHGIGRSMHEDPKVANFVTAEQLRGDFKLRPGMTLAVEPMVVMGSREVDLLPDNWTVVTKDGLPAAHFEHTIAVTENGVDILTDGRAPWGL
ncbi:type I methionyl aminopeptidase [Fontivita pretiosa]|uniref:type I methionyl aminopeptidase n=1 Tax=Fontivita pretiosa TaxID=2989684 RepID=UPI003D1800BC